MERNLALDGLRGLLLMVIAINHIESPLLTPFTRSTLGFVSAAEAFIFLSGFVAALVYGRYAHSPSDLYRKVYKRIGAIYVYTALGVTSVFLLLSLNVLPDTWYHSLGNYFLLSNYLVYPIESLTMTLLQVQQMGYLDILVVYMFAMLFLPKALLLFHQGKGYQVVLTSIGVWLAAHFVNDSSLVELYVAHFPGMKPNSGYMDILAWQVLFYAGVFSHFYFKNNEKQVTNVKLLFGAAALALVFFVMNFTGTLFPVPKVLESIVYSWKDVGLVRFVNTLALAMVISYFVRQRVRVLTFKPFVYLGQHSLQVFTFHAIAIYYFWPWMLDANQSYSFLVDISLTLLFVGSLFAPAFIHQNWQVRGRRQV